jgi:hypothetical protein
MDTKPYIKNHKYFINNKLVEKAYYYLNTLEKRKNIIMKRRNKITDKVEYIFEDKHDIYYDIELKENQEKYKISTYKYVICDQCKILST